jgi:hypothetical protein
MVSYFCYSKQMYEATIIFCFLYGVLKTINRKSICLATLIITKRKEFTATEQFLKALFH